jgi:hypothetical protein
MTADRPSARVAGLVRETWARRPVEGCSLRDASYGPKGGRPSAEFRKSRRDATAGPMALAPDVGHWAAPAQSEPRGRSIPPVGPMRRAMSRGSIAAGPRRQPAATTRPAATVSARLRGLFLCAEGSPRLIQLPTDQCAAIPLPSRRSRAATPWVAPARADAVMPNSSPPFRPPAAPSTP